MFKKIDAKYRPIPFWSWNEKLDVAETKRQAEIMKKAGLGGYIMHARGGLQTEYLGDEWFQNIEAGITCGEQFGIDAWAYDENGWPSGFADGYVNSIGEEYQQKYLRIEPFDGNSEHTLLRTDMYHVYYEVNPFYVDNLNKKVVAAFIDRVYKKYCEKYAGNMAGIFTDEPQLSRNGIPWSNVLPKAFEREYGYDLVPRLPELFYDIEDFKTTRFHFWKLVSKLFTESYIKQVYEYVDSHNMKLTGHMVLEEGLNIQLTTNGAVMPNYEYFHIPGVDFLGKHKVEPLLPLQVSSVAHQLGKKQILTESFACSGHNVNFDELRAIAEQQFVRGVNLLCPHLQGYSLRGIRKRDFPPAMYYQQPWWNAYSNFIEGMSRIGMIMTEGKPMFDTLVIHPQSHAWTKFSPLNTTKVEEMDKTFADMIDVLERKHILFHLGDETILEKYGKAVDDCIVVGTQRYSKVIVPFGDTLFASTAALLSEYQENGGIITTVQDIKENRVCDSENLTYTARHFDNFTVHYFVNETEDIVEAEFYCGAKTLDIATGDIKPFSGIVRVYPKSSVVIVDDGAKITKEPIIDNREKLSLDGAWELKSYNLNVLNLDTCDYWFDGELIDKNAFVLDIGDRANKLERKVNIKMRYTFKTSFMPNKLYMVTETPEQYKIFVNGTEIEKTDCGYYTDISFRKLDISTYVTEGENEILMECDFVQSQEVYTNIKNSKIFESVRNKLTYDMEIEGIFILGNFSVETKDGFEQLSNNAVRFNKNVCLTPMKRTIKLKNIEQQGFPFFSGELTVRKELNLEHTNYKLMFEKQGINFVDVKANGKFVKRLIWSPFEADLSPYLKQGENVIELTFTNNLRNLLGPHHLADGEVTAVGPGSFYKNDSPFAWGVEWNDNYCIVETSLM